MFFIGIVFILGVIAIVMPVAYKVIEMLVLAPIVGLAFGGFAWSLACMFDNELMSFHAFGMFVILGTLFAEVLFLKGEA